MLRLGPILAASWPLQAASPSTASNSVGSLSPTPIRLTRFDTKGRKDRNAMLSPQLLGLLRQWWREGRRRGVMLPQGWLFPGKNSLEPLSTRQLCRAVH